MSKNPFVNCKSRKRRKPRVVAPKPQKKLYCPRTMVRYDDSPNLYSTVWVCKMCLKVLLSAEAVTQHLTICNAVSGKNKTKPTKKNEDVRYICQFCNKVFSRRVTLKKHLEVHEQSVDTDPSDNEVEDPSKTANDGDADAVIEEEEEYDDDDDDDDDGDDDNEDVDEPKE